MLSPVARRLRSHAQPGALYAADEGMPSGFTWPSSLAWTAAMTASSGAPSLTPFARRGDGEGELMQAEPYEEDGGACPAAPP